MTEDVTRQRVISEARTWLETPFAHGQQIKGLGVDCGRLLLGIFANAGVTEPFDLPPYSPAWFMHKDDEIFLACLRKLGREVDGQRPGDVAIFRVGRCYSHGGIVTRLEPLTIIHAVHPYGRVVEEVAEINTQLHAKPSLFFDLIGERR